MACSRGSPLIRVLGGQPETCAALPGGGSCWVVLPDRRKAAINVAADNLIAFLDLEHGQVDSTLTTGAFP